MKSPTFSIIGLGLLGGSLGAALKRVFPHAKVIGVSRSRVKVRFAKRQGFIDEGTTELAKAARLSDFIFICTPVDTIPNLLLKIDSVSRSGTIVTDVGSTKAALIRWVEERKFKNISFVGSHPMAGSHLTGIRYARPDLFEGSITFVTRHGRMDQKAFQMVVKIWKRICDRVIVVDSLQHDAWVAEVSHLPHLMAATLVHIATARALRVAGSGFKDTTRIAQADGRLWVPIFETNRANVLRLIRRQKRILSELENRLRARDMAFLRRFLETAAIRRRRAT